MLANGRVVITNDYKIYALKGFTRNNVKGMILRENTAFSQDSSPMNLKNIFRC